MTWSEYMASLRTSPGDVLDSTGLPIVTTAEDCPSPSRLHFHPPNGDSCVRDDQPDWTPVLSLRDLRSRNV